MTISHDPPPKPSGRASLHQGIANHWRLQEAKAGSASSSVASAATAPQHVTVHGRDEVVVVSAEDTPVSRESRRGPR